MKITTPVALAGAMRSFTIADGTLPPRGWRKIWIVAGILFASATMGRAQLDGWQSVDIGTTTTGSTTVSGDSISISGSGRDIWNEADGFRYYYREVLGEFDFVVRVRSLQDTNGWAKAAIMTRSTLD